MTTPAVQTDASRVWGLDGARIIAALATVLYHAICPPSSAGAGPTVERWGNAGEALRFAVAFFSMVAAFFLVGSLRRNPDRPFGPYATSRFRRLYLPFLGWSAIFLVFSKAEASVSSQGGHAVLSWRILFEGTNTVLWFLPYLLVLTLLAFPLVRFAIRSRQRETAVALTLLVVGVLMSFFPLHGEFDDFVDSLVGRDAGLPFVLSKTWVRAPSFLWGLGLALLWRPAVPALNPDATAPGGARLPMAAVLLGLAAMAVAGAINVTIENARHINALDNIMGVGLFLIALGPTPLQNPGGLARLGGLTYGLYLSHQIFALSMQKGLLPKAHVEPSRITDVAVFVASAGAAIVLTLAIRRSRWTRWLAP